MKKVIYLARKTTTTARKVLESHKQKQCSMDINQAKANAEARKYAISKILVKPKTAFLERHEMLVEYDKKKLFEMISMGGGIEILYEAIDKYPVSFNLPIDDMGMTWLKLAVMNGRVDAARRIC